MLPKSVVGEHHRRYHIYQLRHVGHFYNIGVVNKNAQVFCHYQRILKMIMFVPFLIAINREQCNAATVVSEYIGKNPNKIESALYILSSIRKLERVGDQAKNMAEEIIFYSEAKVLKHKSKIKKASGEGEEQ